MKDVLQEISRLRLRRSWSEYQLAKNAEIPQSTISTWYRKKQIPSIPTLEKVCQGFGITLSQFFAEGDEAVFLTGEEKEVLERWTSLTKKQRTLFLELFKTI